MIENRKITFQPSTRVLVPEINGAIRTLCGASKHGGVSTRKGLVPQVENVPWTGWNEISLTAKTTD